MRRLARRKSRPVDEVHDIKRHRLVADAEHGGLVHVVPEAGDARSHEFGIKAAPPVPYGLAAEVRKYGRARPDVRDVGLSVGRMHEGIGRDAAIVGKVALTGRARDVQVGDQHQAKVDRCKLGDEFSEVGKRRRRHRERPVAILVVDIEVQRVRRDVIVPEARRDRARLALGRVRVTRLLKAEAPQRRERRGPREVGKRLDDRFGCRRHHHVVVDRAAFRAEGQHVALGPAEVEISAPGVVEEEPERAATLENAEREGHGLVERIRRRAETIGVGIPQHERAAAPVEGPRLVAEAEIVSIGRHHLAQPHRRSAALRGTLDDERRSARVGEQHVPRQILDADVQRLKVEPRDGGGGAQHDSLRIGLDGERR